MPKVLKVKDKTDAFTKKFGKMVDLPMRGLLIARSGLGKSNLLVNLMANHDFPYHKVYDGDDIHIFSPTIKQDKKMEIIVEQYDIPDTNLHTEYSDNLVMNVYDTMIEDFEESIQEKEKPRHKLFIIDDLSSSGSFSKNRFNAMNVLFCNSRKFLVSIILLAQNYSHLTPSIRNNANFIAAFNMNLSSLEALEMDHNYLENKKEFIKLFRENVGKGGRNDFFVINYTNDFDAMYMNKEFKPIKMNLIEKK